MTRLGFETRSFAAKQREREREDANHKTYVRAD
jgi:hypothetical protein